MKLKLSIEHNRETPKEVYKIVQRNLRVQARQIQGQCTKKEIDRLFIGPK